QMGDADVTDVAVQGSRFYVAAPGRIDRYDSAARAIDKTWTFDKQGPVSIKAIVNEAPVSLSGGVVRHGSDRLEDGAHNVFVDGPYLSIVSGAKGRRYIRAVPIVSRD